MLTPMAVKKTDIQTSNENIRDNNNESGTCMYTIANRMQKTNTNKQYNIST